MPNYNDEPNKPFNDTMEHQHRIEGFPIKKPGRLPLPIRLIGYFMFGGSILTILLIIIGNFLSN